MSTAGHFQEYTTRSFLVQLINIEGAEEETVAHLYSWADKERDLIGGSAINLQLT